MKVTENLTKPPKFRLTRGLILAPAPTLAHHRVAITGMCVRLALMAQIMTEYYQRNPVDPAVSTSRLRR